MFEPSTKLPQTIIIYHGNCADGFSAAWACRTQFGSSAEYVPGRYGSPPPDCSGRDVILVDFSYKRDVLSEIARTARSVLVLDHHKSAAEDLAADPRTSPGPAINRMDQWSIPPTLGNFHAAVEMDRIEGITACCGATIYAYFDMQRSGAGLAWDFFNPGRPRPPLINHVEDRDLWRFAIPGTREVQAFVFAHEYSWENWDRLMGTTAEEIPNLIAAGAAIERKHHKDVAELVKVCQRDMIIAGYSVPVASLPYTLTSDAGYLMAHGKPFAACYWDTPDRRVFSLRSTDDGMDVATIAETFGGGGHARASGFQVPRDHPLAQQ